MHSDKRKRWLAMRNPVMTRPRTVALAIVATELGAMFVGAILPTPLYPLYRQAFGFSGVTLTLIYAVYVVGNLVALLLFGRLADQIGRRAASLPAIGVGIASTGAFALAASTAWLFAARALSGFSTGLAAGAATAWIAELHPGGAGSRGAAARIASAANFFGCSAGPLIGGVLAQFAFWPLRLPFILYLVLLGGVCIAICFAPETLADPKRISEVSLKPRLGVPRQIWLQFVAPAATSFATFALIAFYAAFDSEPARRKPAPARASCRRRRRLRAVRHCRGDDPFHRPDREPGGNARRAGGIVAERLASGGRGGQIDAIIDFRRRCGRRRRRARLSRQPRSRQPHRAGRPA